MQDKVTLSNEELIERCDKWIVDLCKDRKNWTLSVPVQFNRDPDTLFTELIRRFKEALHPSESAGVKGADIAIYELKIVLHRLLKSFKGMATTELDRKRYDEAERILNKYSSIKDVLRSESPTAAGKVPQHRVHTGNSYQWQDDWDKEEQGELNEEVECQPPTAAGDGKEDAEAVEFTEWATGNYNKIFDEYKNEWLWWNDGIRGYSTSELYTIFKNRNNKP